MRLIDADELNPDVKTFTSLYSEELILFYSQDVIDKAPTVDAIPVKQGKWVNISSYNMNCSLCNKDFDFEYPAEGYAEKWNFCPNCGAKMDKEEIFNEKRM